MSARMYVKRSKATASSGMARRQRTVAGLIEEARSDDVKQVFGLTKIWRDGRM